MNTEMRKVWEEIISSHFTVHFTSQRELLHESEAIDSE